jgi:hypothetical protein
LPHVRLIPTCTDGGRPPTRLWLVFWQQGQPEMPYTWDSPLLEAQFGQTRLLRLDQSQRLVDNLRTVGELILDDRVSRPRSVRNLLAVAQMKAVLGDIPGAASLLDSVGADDEFAAEAARLRRQLPYLNGPIWPDTRVQATWGDQIQLRGYSIQEQPASAEAYHIGVTLFWQALRPPDKDYTVFLHWRNADNVTISQVDFQPYDGARPTSRWQSGELFRETRALSIPAAQFSSPCRLVVGLYDVDTMERLPLINDTSNENVFQLRQGAALP